MFSKSKWIWPYKEERIDDYAEFVSTFKIVKKDNVFLRLSFDSIVNVFLNDKLVFFRQCADYPNYKFFDEIDISKFVKKGNNILKIQVYHSGVDSSIYIKDKAGLIFEVIQDTKIVAFSDTSTQSRTMNEYKNGYQKLITKQLGFSFYFDNRILVNKLHNSFIIKKPLTLHKRDLLPLKLNDKTAINIIKQKNSILIDLKKEIAGFIELDFVSSKDQLITIAYGEHIIDEGVRRKISNRDFSIEFYAKKGINKYLNSFRRIAGRYLEVFTEYPIRINYIGIREVVYPVKIKKIKNFSDNTINKINKICVRTLKCCMHEHYEDSPWREQALYTLDSRNEMLVSYLLSNDYSYQRHNLILISKSLRKDGLLSICAPCGVNQTIPFFSLIYILEVYEYIKFTKDMSILNDISDVLHQIIDTFRKRIDKKHLIANFKGEEYWNFYEWTEFSHGDNKDSKYDLILNCAYVYVHKLYCDMFRKRCDDKLMLSAIKKVFKKKDIYALSNNTNKSSKLGNAFACLIGLGDDKLLDKIAYSKELISPSLAMYPFVYDALLGKKKYQQYVLNNLMINYRKMLVEGATTFYETLEGDKAFNNAGSLCHGWSSYPVYYFYTLLK